MIHNLKSRMEKMKELINTFSKDLEEIKKKQTEMNSTATEIKNTLEGIYSRKTETEEWISKLEDRMVEITAEEQNKEIRNKTIMQMKKQDKKLKGQVNEEEIGKPPEK